MEQADMITNEQYWIERAERVIISGEKSAQRVVRDIQRTYTEAARSIQREIEAFYARHALETQTSITEIRRRLSPEQLRTAREDIAHYYDEVRRLGGYSGDYREYLRGLSARAYLSRFEELQLHLRHDIETLARDTNFLMTNGLVRTYEESYYRTMFAQQQGFGIGWSFAVPDRRAILQAVQRPWLGENYSDRVWNHKDRLIHSLETTFTQGVVLGHNPNKIARQMSANVQSQAFRPGVQSPMERLARTEFARCANQAILTGYRERGIKEYAFLATLDFRTSKICQALDGKVFKVSEAIEGTNYPPMHPNCRSTTVPHFADLDKAREGATRAARDPETGETYYVPADWTYEQWRDSLTVEQGRAYMSNRAKAENNASDREQFAGYRQFITDARKQHGSEIVNQWFDGFPRGFRQFQEMKYTRPDEWEIFKDNRRQLTDRGIFA
jgi:SPP1 gp7 family putative phage head morphogenesis protein